MTSNSTDKPSKVTGIILAGGAGKRMGGADKGLMSLQGRPLIEHVIETLEPQVDDLLIVANRNAATYAEFGYPVVPDTLSGYAGPLIGMQAGLNACRTDIALFAPADAPALPVDLADRLLAATDAKLAVAADAEGWQPLCCLLPKSVMPSLDQAIDNNQRSPKAWLQTIQPAVVSFSGEDLIWSVNTPDELSALQQHPGLAA